MPEWRIGYFTKQNRRKKFLLHSGLSEINALQLLLYCHISSLAQRLLSEGIPEGGIPNQVLLTFGASTLSSQYGSVCRAWA